MNHKNCFWKAVVAAAVALAFLMPGSTVVANIGPIEINSVKTDSNEIQNIEKSAVDEITIENINNNINNIDNDKERGIEGIPILFLKGVIYVDDNRPSEWYDATHVHTIQEGVNNATIGDTIYVYSGTYDENVIVNKQVNLVGESKEDTIVDGGASDTFYLSAPYVNMSHFTIHVNGARGINIVSNYNQILDCDIFSAYDMQYCLWINYASDNTITNCSFIGGYTGIQIHGSSGGDYNTIEGCSFSYNRKAGMELNTGCSYNEITNCVFSNNTGYGLYIYQNSLSNQITGCIITGNSGVGLFIERASYNIFRNNSLFDNIYDFDVEGLNSIPYYSQDIDTSNMIEGKSMYYLVDEDGYSLNGSNIDVGYIALISCKNTTVSDVAIEESVMGIRVVNTSNSFLTRCSFLNNQKKGINLLQTSKIQIMDCTVAHNGEEGIYASQLDATPTNCTLTGCSCFDNGKDGVYLKGSGDQVINCNCSYNTKTGIHLEAFLLVTGCVCIENKEYGIYGGSYYHPMDSCQIIHCRVVDNAGGIYLCYSNGGVVAHCDCFNNKGNGLRIDASSNIQVTHCNSSNNLGKGADFSGTTSLVILNCTFSANTGDGIRYGASQMTECTIVNNQGSGVVFTSGVMMTGCLISGNQQDGVRMGSSFGASIQDCVISDNQGNGVTGSSSNSVIEGCTISANQNLGVLMTSSQNNQITACTISNNNGGGVHIYSNSNGNNLTACTISGNQQKGLYIESSSTNSIQSCLLLNNYHGLYLYAAQNNIFRNCSLWYNTYGLTIDGTSTSDFIQDIDPSNRINGKAIYYLLEQSDIVIDGDVLDISYIALVRCQRIELKNVDINSSTQGILVIETSDSTITNCTGSNNLLHGLYLLGSNTNTITGCTFEENAKNGLYVHDSDYVTITNCTALGNQEYGILINDSDYVIITNCMSSENQFGLALAASAYDKMRYNTLVNNTYNFGILPVDVLGESGPGPDLYQDILDPGQPATNTVNGKGIYYYNPLMGTIAPPIIDGQAMSIGYLVVIMAGYQIVDPSVPIPPTTIQNVDLSHNIQGLTMLGCFGCTIENVTSTHSYGFGMGFLACQWNTITNCNASYNQGPIGGVFPPDGMWFMLDLAPGALPGNTITNCTAFNNTGHGISLNAFWGAGCYNYIVAGCTCAGNGGSGIAITADSDDNLITSCVCYNNNDSGITVSWISYNNIVQYCTCFNNLNSGIDLQWNSPTTVENCFCSYNTYGISTHGSGSIIRYCTTLHNERGIQLNPSTSGGVSITNCNISDNLGHGIYGFHVIDNEISNCTILNNLGDGIHMDLETGLGWMTNNILSNNNNTGIYIDSGTYAITNCTISNSDTGVYIGRSSNNQLRETLIHGGEYGLIIEGLTIEYLHQDIDDSNTIDGKKIYYLDGDSDLVIEDDFGYLALVSCDNITVQSAATIHGLMVADTTNSTISGVISWESANGVGISLWEGSHNSIISCDSSDNSNCGLMIRDSPDNYLHGNIITNNTVGLIVEGIVLAEFYQNIDTSNTVNGKPVYYLVTESDEVIDGLSVGYLALISCMNITVQDVDAPGILLADTNDSTIVNVDSHGGKTGIYLWMSHNNIIGNCDVYNNTAFGILLRNSDDNIIENCRSYNNLGDALNVQDQSSYNEIINCSLFGNSGGGINIDHSPNNTVTGCVSHNNAGLIEIRVNYAQRVDVTNCTVYNNEYYGIYYYTRVYDSDNSNIVNCTVYNTQYGIYLAFTDDSTIRHCVLLNNSRGIHLYASSVGNTIHHNKLINNGINGWDECTNQWDDGREGNYWSDYSGVDNNGDGIGDTPYNVPGGGGNKDQYPLLFPNSYPYIPSEPTPGHGATGVDINATLSWVGGDPDDEDIVTYDVYFATTSPPSKVVSNQSGTTYNLGTMSHSQKYYWQIVAWDNHGASTTGPIWNFTTVEQPNYPPNTPSNPDPANHAANVDINVLLGWTGGDPNTGDILTYDIYLGTTSTPPKVASNQSATTYTPGTLVYETQYYWRIIAWDNHGASTEGPVWDFTTVLDTTPPVTTHTLQGTIGGNQWYVSDVTVILNATDDLSGVNVTRYRINNGVWTMYTNPFTVTADGMYAIDYYSVDNEGNIEFPNSMSFKIDQTPPVTAHAFNPTAPNGENGWYVSNVIVTLISTDGMSGVESTWYRIGSGSWNLYTAPFTISADGVHALYYYAYDNAGNFEGIKTVTIKIDKTSPTTTCSFEGDLGDNGWYISNVTVTLSAQDATSLVNTTWYTLDDTWMQYTQAFTVTVDNEHTLRYYSVDYAGNNESEKSAILKIDQTPPTLTLTKQKKIGEIVFTATVDDPTSGVNKVEFYIDELLQFTDTEAPYQWTWSGFGRHIVKAIAYDNASNSNTASISTQQSSEYIQEQQSTTLLHLMLQLIRHTKLYQILLTMLQKTALYGG